MTSLLKMMIYYFSL
uniref:Uncharacterized protein n=1 Tax=Anguilla anguilla TaxID=7936 RepID=A0A0E9ULM0_ANGAN